MHDRIAIANMIVSEFAPGTSIKKSGKGWMVVSWADHRGNTISRRWQTQERGSFFPVWFKLWAHGGTCCAALTMLVRWTQGKPVLPLKCWDYWHKNGLKVDKQSLEKLKASGYPTKAICVRCGKEIDSSIDWFDDGKNSGSSHIQCPTKEV